MKFQKGEPRPANAGRKKGTKNKSTNFIERCANINLDLLACLIQDLENTPPFQRVDVWLKLLEFYYPKQKNIAIGNADQEGFRIVIEDYTKK